MCLRERIAVHMLAHWQLVWVLAGRSVIVGACRERAVEGYFYSVLH